jgi:hypothetical protein
MVPVLEGILVGICIGVFNRVLRFAESLAIANCSADHELNMYQSSGVECDADEEVGSPREHHG